MSNNEWAKAKGSADYEHGGSHIIYPRHLLCRVQPLCLSTRFHFELWLVFVQSWRDKDQQCYVVAGKIKRDCEFTHQSQKKRHWAQACTLRKNPCTRANRLVPSSLEVQKRRSEVFEKAPRLAEQNVDSKNKELKRSQTLRLLTTFSSFPNASCFYSLGVLLSLYPPLQSNAHRRGPPSNIFHLQSSHHTLQLAIVSLDHNISSMSCVPCHNLSFSLGHGFPTSVHLQRAELGLLQLTIIC